MYTHTHVCVYLIATKIKIISAPCEFREDRDQRNWSRNGNKIITNNYWNSRLSIFQNNRKI